MDTQVLKRLGTIAICLLAIQACSSISAHWGEEFGHPYSGTQSAFSSSPCTLAVSSTALFLPAPFIIVDIPLSAILDTLLLPADLVITPGSSRKDVIYTAEKCYEGMRSTPPQKREQKRPQE